MLELPTRLDTAALLQQDQPLGGTHPREDSLDATELAPIRDQHLLLTAEMDMDKGEGNAVD